MWKFEAQEEFEGYGKVRYLLFYAKQYEQWGYAKLDEDIDGIETLYVGFKTKDDAIKAAWEEAYEAAADSAAEMAGGYLD